MWFDFFWSISDWPGPKVTPTASPWHWPMIPQYWPMMLRYWPMEPRRLVSLNQISDMDSFLSLSVGFFSMGTIIFSKTELIGKYSHSGYFYPICFFLFPPRDNGRYCLLDFSASNNPDLNITRPRCHNCDSCTCRDERDKKYSESNHSWDR